VTTAVPDALTRRPEGVPIWIIIVAVIAGVILLSLLIVCLWKVLASALHLNKMHILLYHFFYSTFTVLNSFVNDSIYLDPSSGVGMNSKVGGGTLVLCESRVH